MTIPPLYQAMHRALHSQTSSLVFDNKIYKVEQGNTGLRYIRYNNTVFAQQDPSQRTYLARLARTTPITRIVRTGRKWGWISNSEFADPLYAK